MAIRKNQNTSKVKSSDNADYQRAFYRESLLLLTCGHERLLAEMQFFSNSEEPDITGELVRCTQEYLDDINAPEWSDRYEVYEESPENTKGRKGKSRKKVDIVCTLTQRRPRLRMKFEAKRLKEKTHPIRVYLGKEGLQEFLTGSYAPKSSAVGMLGYMQSHDETYWVEELSNSLEGVGIQLKRMVLSGNKNCCSSIHERITNKQVCVYHLLLDFLS